MNKTTADVVATEPCVVTVIRGLPNDRPRSTIATPSWYFDLYLLTQISFSADLLETLEICYINELTEIFLYINKNDYTEIVQNCELYKKNEGEL